MAARKRTAAKEKPSDIVKRVQSVAVGDRKVLLEQGHWTPPEELAPKRRQWHEPSHSMHAFHDLQSVPDAVKQRIKDHDKQAWASFQKLVSLDLDEGFLCDLLATIQLTFPSHSQVRFQDLFGFRRKQLPKVLNRMRKCASDIESLRITFLRDIAPELGSGTKADKSLPQAVMLPSLLRAVANRLERAASANRKRGRPYYDAALAALVWSVRRTSRSYHHGDVASVVAAMRGDDYSIQAHKDWVRRNARLVRNPW